MRVIHVSFLIDIRVLSTAPSYDRPDARAPCASAGALSVDRINWISTDHNELLTASIGSDSDAAGSDFGKDMPAVQRLNRAKMSVSRILKTSDVANGK